MALDPVTAGLAFATAIAQVTLASVRLKKLWGQISQVPGDLRTLETKLEMIDILLTELETIHNTSISAPDSPTARCRQFCLSAYQELETSAKEIQVKLRTKGRIGRRVVFAKTTLNDVLSNQEKRLNEALNLLLHAHHITLSRYVTEAISMEASRRVTEAPPSPVAPGQPQPSLPSTESESDEASSIESSVVLESESHPRASTKTSRRTKYRRPHQGWAKRLRFPSWWSKAVYELRSMPQLSSYVFRVYNIVSEESHIIQSIMEGDVAEVRILFESKLASPYDIDPDGRSLLHYAANPPQPDIVKVLLELGGRDSLVIPAGEGQFTPWRSMIYHLLDADEDDAMFEQVLEVTRRHLVRNETIPKDLLFDTDIVWLMHRRPGAFDLLRRKLLVDYYNLAIQERVEYVRWASLCRFRSDFVAGLFSRDGTVAREDMQESTAMGTSLLHSAAIGMGLGLRLEALPNRGLRSIEKSILEHHTARWTRWIEEMARVCTPKDLHPVSTASSIYLTRGAPWRGTPLLVMTSGLICVLLRSELKTTAWDSLLQTVLKEWLGSLRAGGVDLLEYGTTESSIIHSGHISWEPLPQRGCQPAVRLVDFEIGPEPEDWRVLWAFEFEPMALEFWEMVEGPRGAMPGAYDTDDDLA